MQNTKAGEMQVERETSLVDIIRFLSFNFKFLGLTTVCLSAIAIILSMFLLKQYQKHLSLLVKPVLAPISKPIPSLDANQINAVVRLLQYKSGEQTTLKRQADVDKITTRTKYNPTTQQLDVSLQSPDPSLLNAVTPTLISQLKTEFPATIKETIQTSITSTELQIDRNQAAVAYLEQQVAKLKLSSNLSNPQELQTNPQELRTIARLEALERQRATYLTAIATLKYDAEYLEKVQQNPVEFADKIISLQILRESAVRQTPSLLQVTVLAVIASFMVAIFAVIIHNQIGHLKEELYKQKIEDFSPLTRNRL